jgi:hypothetical protein
VTERPLQDDTDLDAERVQLELLRRAGVARRVALAGSLSRMVIDLARRQLREEHPDATEQELKILFVERHYGPELAAGLREYLRRRPQST